MTENARLRTKQLSVGHNGKAVVQGLDLTVEQGEIMVLLGRNGAGKTTTIQTIAGLIPVVSGELEIGGEPAKGPLHHRVRRGLGLVGEERMVVRGMSVRDNLRLASKTPEAAWDLFPELKRLENRKAGLLSGGEQQMLALARAIVLKPDLLLVDELSFGLAPLITERLLDALRTAAQTYGMGVLMVEQYAKVALPVADRGCVISGGVVSLSGTAAELLDRFDEIERSYLSEPVGAQ